MKDRASPPFWISMIFAKQSGKPLWWKYKRNRSPIFTSLRRTSFILHQLGFVVSSIQPGFYPYQLVPLGSGFNHAGPAGGLCGPAGAFASVRLLGVLVGAVLERMKPRGETYGEAFLSAPTLRHAEKVCRSLGGTEVQGCLSSCGLRPCSNRWQQ